MLKGNRGEWSEVYAFLRILADGEIEPADANLNVLNDEPAIPVVRTVASRMKTCILEYRSFLEQQYQRCQGYASGQLAESTETSLG